MVADRARSLASNGLDPRGGPRRSRCDRQGVRRRPGRPTDRGARRVRSTGQPRRRRRSRRTATNRRLAGRHRGHPLDRSPACGRGRPTLGRGAGHFGHHCPELATGWAARVHHIVDPSTGEPCEPVWPLVSIVAPSCVEANSYATAAVVWGGDAPGNLSAYGTCARLVDQDGSVTYVGEWPLPGRVWRQTALVRRPS